MKNDLEKESVDHPSNENEAMFALGLTLFVQLIKAVLLLHHVCSETTIFLLRVRVIILAR